MDGVPVGVSNYARELRGMVHVLVVGDGLEFEDLHTAQLHSVQLSLSQFVAGSVYLRYVSGAE